MDVIAMNIMQVYNIGIYQPGLCNKFVCGVARCKAMPVEQAGVQGMKVEINSVAYFKGFGCTWPTPASKCYITPVPVLQKHFADIFGNAPGAARIYGSVDLEEVHFE